MYTMDAIIKKGAYEAVTQEASFSELLLDCTDDGVYYIGKHFGIYQMFTAATQWTYGMKDELIFILGAMAVLREMSDNNNVKLTDEWTVAAETETVENMKNIAKLYNVNIIGNSYDGIYNELNISEKFNVGNYFYFYRSGKFKYHSLLSALKGYNLLNVG